MLNKSNSLRVLMVASRYFPYMGGMETHVFEVGHRLAYAGVEVTVLTTKLNDQLPDFEQSKGIQIRRVRAWPANKDYYFAPSMYNIITRGQWDLVHCQGYHNSVPPLAMLAAKHAKIPYILTFHSAGHSSRLRTALRGLQLATLRPLLSQARKLIAVTKFEAEFFQKRLRLPAEQFTIIPNGAQLPVIQKPLEGAKKEKVSDFLIVSIGRLERYKGHQRLISALPKVREQIPNVRARIVGSGPYEAELHRIAKELGVAEHVEILAIPPEDRSGMASIITQADLVTLFSEYESQGIAVLEALALQRPVIVAGTSALQEFADSGLAYAIPLDSTPEEIAAILVRQLRRPLIPVNVEYPTWDNCSKRLLALYQDITRGTKCAS